MSKDDFLRQFPAVSHETISRLSAYEKLLIEWNEKINLIAPSTVPQIWTRHFMDSYQLFDLIADKDAVLADIGSGAGFPGLVLACAGMKNIHLIESIGKKANFLREVAKELDLPVTVHNDRAEKIKGLNADIVTARAVASLRDLLPLAHKLAKPGGTMLFLKGKTAPEELTESGRYWIFNIDNKVSLSDPSGVILTIKNLKNRGAGAVVKKNPVSRKQNNNRAQ